MSAADPPMERLLSAAKKLPPELSLEETTSLFLSPSPPPTVTPWFGAPLKFLLMFTTFGALFVAFTLITSGQPTPGLTAFPVAEVLVNTPASNPNVQETGQLQVTNGRIPATATALLSTSVPTTIPLEGTVEFSTPINITREKEEVVTENEGPSPLPAILPESFATDNSWREKPSRREKSEGTVKTTERERVETSSSDAPITQTPSRSSPLSAPSAQRAKWGLENTGYVADTLASCCPMQLTLRGRFRLRFNPELDKKQLVVYGTPAAIAAMTTKTSFRKMVLRTRLNKHTIDMEVNPKSLKSLHLRGKAVLIEE